MIQTFGVTCKRSRRNVTKHLSHPPTLDKPTISSDTTNDNQTKNIGPHATCSRNCITGNPSLKDKVEDPLCCKICAKERSTSELDGFYKFLEENKYAPTKDVLCCYLEREGKYLFGYHTKHTVGIVSTIKCKCANGHKWETRREKIVWEDVKK